MNSLYTMADCTTGFEYIKRDGDPKQIAITLLKQIEEKEGCKGLNKYEMALTIVNNDKQRMIRIGADANSMRRLKMISDAILYEQTAEKTKRENLEFAREFKEKQSVRSSISSDNSSTQPQTGMSAMSEEERQKKIEEDRKKRLADYEAAQAAKKSAPKKKKFFGIFGGNKTKKSKKGMSLCVKKTAKKCIRVRGCKVASGKKRTYCRKKKNHTQKSHKK